jgi:hypothetical protein
MTVVVALFVFASIVWGVVGLVQWGRGRVDSNRKALVASQAETRRAESALGDAEKVFRRIANGAGSPELEAQIALDMITKYHEGE